MYDLLIKPYDDIYRITVTQDQDTHSSQDGRTIVSTISTISTVSTISTIYTDDRIYTSECEKRDALQ